MKKILIMINNLGVGGAERLVVNDVNEMLRRGILVKILTLRPEPAHSLKRECNIVSSDFHNIYFNSLYTISAWIETFVFLKKEKPDILITHLWFANTIGRILGKLLNIKKIISFEHNIYSNIKNYRMFFLDKLLQNYSHVIVAVSSAVKKMLIDHGIKAEKIKVLVNAVDIEVFRNAKPASRENFGIEQDDFVFLSVGRLIHQKGMDILIEAFAKTERGALIIVGQGKDEMLLKEKVKCLNLERRVKFLGIRSDIPALLKMSDCFVLASRYEGFGIVVIEAMAAGKPIIVSEFDARKDFIDDGKNAIVVPIEDSKTLYEAMKSIQQNPVLQQKLAREATLSSLNFSTVQHVDHLLGLIN